MNAQVIDTEKIIAPLPGEQPCGESARYEPEYEELQTEIGKQDALTPEPVDWGQVVSLSKSLLEEKTKDLLVASYLSMALFEQKGYAGLAEGLKIYQTFIQQFWEDMFPEKRRLRGRAGAATWLAEKLEKAMEARKPAVADKEHVSEIAGLVKSIDASLNESLGDSAPDFGPVNRALKEFERDLEQKTKPAQPAQAAPAAAQGAATVVASEQDVPKALRQCQQTLRGVAAFLRDAKLEDPRHYRLNRMGTWLLVDQVPPGQNNVTQLAAVPAAIVQKYDSYVQSGNYTALITEAEESFSKAPFWLDAHRYVTIALEALGAGYSDAQDAVIDELRHFLKRLPGLLDTKFADGTAFASDQTRLWIESDVLISESGTGQASAGAGTDEAGSWTEAAHEAKKLAAKGKMKDAVALFTDGAKASGSERERFFWHLNQATFCFDAGLIEIATPQLEHLNQLVQRFSLEEWEPALAVEVARVLLMCYAKSLEKNKKLAGTLSEKMEDLYARVCRLDIDTALSMDIKLTQQPQPAFPHNR